MNIRILLTTGLLSYCTLASAQVSETDRSLQGQFELMKKQANNYQEYKVVKQTALDNFWKSVSDSLQSERKQINNLSAQVAELQTKVNELETAVSAKENAMLEQSHLIETMDFAGVTVSKATYKTLSWIVITGLFVLSAVLFVRFKGANRITVETRRDYEMLQTDFESHRQKARETEARLKRELQTELNRLDELMQKSTSKVKV